jgi:hypothetical protein
MCKCLENPIPVHVWTLDGNCYLGDGKIMGTGTSHHALLADRMITPLEWGGEFDPCARACLAHVGATLVTVLEDQIILMDDACPMFASQVAWKEA